MTALSIQPTYPIFTDVDGRPLEDGYLWIGAANLDPQVNPVSIYWDAALTIPAAQPVRTLAGYPSNSGSPARLYVGSDYSIRVMNKNGSVVYSAAAATERYSSAVVDIVLDAANVAYTPSVTGGVPTTVEEKLSQVVSPKDFGAVGNGVADDTAAVRLAIESGFVVDGGGLTYAINGTCAPTSITGLQNANFVQIGNTVSTDMTVLDVRGLSNFFIDNVNINMGAGVTTLFSDDGNNGLRVWGTQSGLTTNYIQNFKVTRVTVTGNGCGTGIHIRHARQFVASDCLVHDRIAGSSPDPTNDSQNGIQINNCYDFSVSNLSVDNLKTRVGGVDTNKWTRGILFAEIRDCSIVGCNVNAVDQGYGFSGAYVAANGYIGSRRWAISGSVATDCLTYGFKFANVTRDGLVSGCLATRIGTMGFVFSPSAVALPVGLEKYNTQNIDVVGCKVVDVLGNGWSSSNAQGFRVMSNPLYPDYPRSIRLKGCSVIDTQDVPTTLGAYAGDATVPLYPTAGYNASVANTTSGCTFSSNIPSGFNGIGPDSCRVTGTGTQSLTSGSFGQVNWDLNLIDPSRLHNVASNNNAIYVKTSGFYEIKSQVQFGANVTGSRIVRLYKNGSIIDRSTSTAVPSSGTNTTVVTSAIEYLVAGDGISIAAYQNSGSALNAALNESYLSVQLVG